MSAPSLPKFISFLILLFFAGSACFSQPQKEVDSLLKYAEETKDDREKSKALNKVGALYRSMGLPERGMEYGKASLLIAVKSKDIKGQAESYNEMGLCHQAKLHWDEALSNYLKSLALFEMIRERSGSLLIESNIGNVYREMRNYPEALAHIGEAKRIADELGDDSKTALVNCSFGAVYYDMNEPEKAIDYFKKALPYYSSPANRVDQAALVNNIGNIYNEMEKHSEAIDNYKTAMEIYAGLGDSSSIAMCLANIGNVYNVSGDPKKGLEYISQCIDLSKRINDKSILAAAYGFMIEGLTQSDNFKEASEYQAKLLSLKDSIYDLQTNQNIAEMQTRFDTEKKEKQNEILKQQNELQNLSINRQKIINYSVTLGLILVLVLAFFIYRGYAEKKKANLQLEEKNMLIQEKNKIVEEKNKDITDSIRYAKRLQTAILKPEETFTNYFEDGFILFRPKDIVSGDFYWFEKFGNLSLVAAADCTGHGVPGAFMSIIGCNLLSQAVNEYAITQTGAILNSINKGLTKVLQQKGEQLSVTDGMDIALMTFDAEKMMVEYSGAYNPLWLIRNGELTDFPADKFPVGAFVDKEVRQFSVKSIPVKKGDMIYLFSDGYADQFGGPQGKKFKYKQLQNVLLECSSKPGREQRAILSRALENWMGKLEQIDDVLVIGIRI